MQRWLWGVKRFVLLSSLVLAGCKMPGMMEHHPAGAAAMDMHHAQVATRSATVMPFNLDATTHIFEKQPQGGLQQVVAKDPNDLEQIKLIRAHLSEEAQRFQQGDFHDPAQIHDMTMPGLHELMMGAKQITIQYSELPNGAQIAYTTTEPALVNALHAWFDAQVADHGAAATDHQ